MTASLNPSWISISRLLVNNDLMDAQKHIKAIAKEFPTRIKFISYKNGTQYHTYIADTFAKQFLSLLSGLPGTAPVILAMQYGIPEAQIKAACMRLYISHRSIVAYNPAKKRYSILKPTEFLKLSGLGLRAPFEDANWITLGQLVEQIYTPRMDKNEIREVHIMPLTFMLREFAQKYPQAVYDNMARTHYDAINKFDPMRIRREYVERFKRTFELDDVSRTKLKQETHTKDDATLDNWLKIFGDRNVDAVSYNKTTRELTLRKSFLPQFIEYASAMQKRAIMERGRDESLSAQQIIDSYKFKNLISIPILEKRMKNFALHNPNAVTIQDKNTLLNTGLGYYIGVRKEYIGEFIEFSGLKTYNNTVSKKAPHAQQAIDPALPGYQPDKTLTPASDIKMNEIAWRLAKKKVQSADTANEIIFAQWMQKSRKRKA